MKKVFFAAVLATVAIGGAFATNAKVQTGNFYTLASNSVNITCPGGTGLCSAKYPNITAFNKPASDPTRVKVNLSLYRYKPSN